MSKCHLCRCLVESGTGYQTPLRLFCGIDCAIASALADQDKIRQRQEKKKSVAVRGQHRADKERIKSRHDWYNDLKTEKHYYIKHILRAGQSCYTCGKQQSFGDDHRAFHVGHYLPGKEVDPRRFMVENLRIQCYKCNSKLSGNQAEYRKRLVEEMGIDHVEWLECSVNHKELKEIYPHYTDIQKEIAYLRKINREHKKQEPL